MTTFKFDFDPLLSVADKLGQVASGGLGGAAAAAVNEVVLRFDEKQRRAQNAGLNLSDAYIARLTTFKPATPGDTQATLTTRGGLTIMGHYSPRTLTNPGSRRSAGVAVQIRRGQDNEQRKWFLMKLMRGSASGDSVGVFVRNGKRKVHLYGPSPYSLFRYQIRVGEAELQADLEKTAVAKIGAAIDKGLST